MAFLCIIIAIFFGLTHYIFCGLYTLNSCNGHNFFSDIAQIIPHFSVRMSIHSFKRMNNHRIFSDTDILTHMCTVLPE